MSRAASASPRRAPAATCCGCRPTGSACSPWPTCSVAPARRHAHRLRRTRSPPAAALHAAGQAGHLPVHARRAVAGRYVRPQAALTKHDGKPYPGQKPRVQFAQTGNLLAVAVEVPAGRQVRHCRSATCSRTSASCADDLCVIRSVHADNSAHGGALLQLHTGSDTFVRPRIGSWVTYGLGTENQNLPGFITICPTLGHGGVQNWSSAFLPAAFQGTPIGHAGITAEGRHASTTSPARTRPADLQRLQLDLLQAGEPAAPGPRAARTRPSRGGSTRSSWPSACRPRPRA